MPDGAASMHGGNRSRFGHERMSQGGPMSSSSAVPVTAAIITRNEEKHIARCLGSLTWADEILVVDAQSTDQTAAICLDQTAKWASKMKFCERPWTGFRDQRSFTLETAKNDWIL